MLTKYANSLSRDPPYRKILIKMKRFFIKKNSHKDEVIVPLSEYIVKNK